MIAPRRILLAKTGLDGHWRGVTLVADVLRDAGFEVIMIGMSSVDEIVQAAIDEDVDLIGLSVGGHVAVAERAIHALRDADLKTPVFAGGVVPPRAKQRLEELGAEVYPPGSQPHEIVSSARRLTGLEAAAPTA